MLGNETGDMSLETGGVRCETGDMRQERFRIDRRCETVEVRWGSETRDV